MNTESNFQLPDETFDDIETQARPHGREDVEGHKKSPLVPELDDVEGRKRGLGAIDDGEDVEGHKRAGG